MSGLNLKIKELLIVMQNSGIQYSTDGYKVDGQ